MAPNETRPSADAKCSQVFRSKTTEIISDCFKEINLSQYQIRAQVTSADYSFELQPRQITESNIILRVPTDSTAKTQPSVLYKAWVSALKDAINTGIGRGQKMRSAPDFSMAAGAAAAASSLPTSKEG